jgi:hypothetical protein
METFEYLLYQLHLSYLQARKNKRNTHNQLAFELNQETNLHQLTKAIFERKYTPKPCIAFIIQKPVMLYFLSGFLLIWSSSLTQKPLKSKAGFYRTLINQLYTTT